METTWLNAQDADFDAKLAALTAWSEERDEEVADRKFIANSKEFCVLAASLVGPPCAGAARLPAITPDYP